MDDQHPKYDQRPKRRKDKDNPYVIFIDNAESLDVHYYIRFRDGENVEHCLEIKKELFDLLDSFELEDLRHLNAVDNHYEHSELTESTLNKRAFYPPKTIDAIVNFKMECEELHSAIRLLPITQRRRLILYYFGELTHEQIAEMEGCSHQAVEKSIKAALKKLKKFLS
ncbi:MAG: sigma-70 family RNA polymerase sigma factor [Oscillospiraceae bacterium]|nr:sigma-70 family RNA polymerase sigma factor [Oscillospiraceae bacterium]